MRLGKWAAGAALAVLGGCGPAPTISADNTTVEQFAACVENEDPNGYAGIPGCFLGSDQCAQYCPGLHDSAVNRVYFGCSPALEFNWQPTGGSCSIAHTAGTTTYWCCSQADSVTLVKVPKSP